MSTKYITNEIEVDLSDSAKIQDNGLTGDALRSIWQERDTGIVWIETNGAPEIYETIADAKERL